MNLAGEKKTYEPLALLSTLMLMSFFARFQLQIVNMGFFLIFNDSFQRLIHMSAGSSLVTELSTHVTTPCHSTCTIRVIDWLSKSFSGLPISCHTPSHIPQFFLAPGGTKYFSGIVKPVFKFCSTDRIHLC